MLRLWDESTEQLNALWPQIPPQRFQETLTAFGQYTDVLHDLILYVIDNEIHHRGQGYVYLRALGIEPPPFYDRELTTNRIGAPAVYVRYERTADGRRPSSCHIGNPADRLAALFDSHHDRLYRLARRLSPSADDALDLVQETFLKQPGLRRPFQRWRDE